MEIWAFDATIAMLAFGLHMALLKVPSSRGIDRYELMLYQFAVSALIAITTFYSSLTTTPLTISLGFAWATGYVILTLLQIHSLATRDTGHVFPFTSLLSNILVVIFGVLLLKEELSLLQYIAIALSMIFFVFSFRTNRIHFGIDVIPLFLGIAIISTANKFVQKFGAMHNDPYDYITWIFISTFCVAYALYVHKRHTFRLRTPSLQLVGWGILMGVMNFVGTLYVIKALANGPISLVYTIIGLYIFFTTLFAALLFKERITKKILISIAVSFVIVLLIKLG